MDKLEAQPEPGMDTLFKAMKKRYNDPRTAAMPYLGTRTGNVYDWISYKDTMDIAK
jgi:long-chain acyl-CoA synthetase